MNNIYQNRNLLPALLFFVCCFSSSFAFSQKTAHKISRFLKRGKIEKIVALSIDEISALNNADDLRSIGEIMLEDLQYDKSAYCYEQLVTEYKTSVQTSDYVNYYFCLLNTGKNESILKVDNQEVDTNRWVKMLKTSARAQSYFASRKEIDPLVLKSNINPSYGFSVTNDTLRYFTEKEQCINRVILEETATILRNKSSDRDSKAAVYKGSHLEEIYGYSMPLKINYEQFGGRQIFVSEKSNDVFYSVESYANRRLAIKIKSDKITPFPYNSEEYDCAMPFFEEKSQTLYFCSNKPGGFGSWDIYACRYSEGKWQEPKNLGEQVNTPFMEIFPHITDYGLMFSSNGGIGAGGFDNYLFSFRDKSSRNMTRFNSSEDDFCLQEVNNTTIGIKKGTLVDYQLMVKNSFSDIQNDEEQLFAYLYPEKVEAARREKIRQDSLLRVAQQAKIRKEKQEYERKLVEWNSLNSLFFEIEQTSIEETQKTRIDSMIQCISDLHVKQIYVFAYADGFGTFLFNRSIATKRAFSLMDQLASAAELKGVTFIPVIMGETLSLPDKADCKTRKVELKIASEVFPGKGLLAVQPDDEKSSVSCRYYESADLPSSDKMSYVNVKTWHKVARGETIVDISLKYNCPIESIRQLNNIVDNIIMLDEYLFIPQDNLTTLIKNNN